MTLTLYWTHLDASHDEYLRERPRLVPYAVTDLEGALKQAFHIMSQGWVPWEIIDADRIVMDRSAIAKAVAHRYGTHKLRTPTCNRGYRSRM